MTGHVEREVLAVNRDTEAQGHEFSSLEINSDVRRAGWKRAFLWDEVLLGRRSEQPSDADTKREWCLLRVSSGLCEDGVRGEQ